MARAFTSLRMPCLVCDEPIILKLRAFVDPDENVTGRVNPEPLYAHMDEFHPGVLTAERAKEIPVVDRTEQTKPVFNYDTKD